MAPGASRTWHADWGFRAVACSGDATHVWVVIADIIRGTTNGGDTWTDLADTGALIGNIAFSDLTHGWLVGAEGAVMATDDGGTSWSEQVSGTHENLDSVACVSDATHCWAVGANGTVLATSDGGTIWSPESSGTAAELYDVDFSDVTHGWAVGADGTILATSISVTEQAVALLDFFNQAWSHGTLMPLDRSPKVAQAISNGIKNQLEQVVSITENIAGATLSASAVIGSASDGAKYKGAIHMLKRIYAQCDGQDPPSDLIAGPAREEFATSVLDLIAAMEDAQTQGPVQP